MKKEAKFRSIKFVMPTRTITLEVEIGRKMEESKTETIEYEVSEQEGYRYIDENGESRFQRTGGAFEKGKICDAEQIKYFRYLDSVLKEKGVEITFPAIMTALEALDQQGWLKVEEDLKAEWNLWLLRARVKELNHELVLAKRRAKDATALHNIRVHQRPELVEMFPALNAEMDKEKEIVWKNGNAQTAATI